METRNLYEVELKDEFEKIKKIDIVSDEHRKVVSDISQLTDRLVKLEEVENEKQRIENEKQKIEIEQQKANFERDKIEADKERAAIEQRKIELEKEKIKIEERRVKIEKEQLEDDRKDKLIKNILAGLSVAIPAGITLTGMVLMFLFEENGTITSKAGNKIIDRIFRK